MSPFAQFMSIISLFTFFLAPKISHDADCQSLDIFCSFYLHQNYMNFPVYTLFTVWWKFITSSFVDKVALRILSAAAIPILALTCKALFFSTFVIIFLAAVAVLTTRVLKKSAKHCCFCMFTSSHSFFPIQLQPWPTNRFFQEFHHQQCLL